MEQHLQNWDNVQNAIKHSATGFLLSDPYEGITLNISPVSAPRMTQSDRWKSRPCVLRYRAFRDELRYKLQLKRFVLGDAVEMIFYLPMPKSWSKRLKKEMVGKPMQKRPDTDNLSKAVLDAVMREDGQVYRIHAAKFWATEGKIRLRNL
tara:strand:- start:142 stop:591 length:450 start_codon:yes stop_codon:yes gene_type:complete